MDCNVDLYLKTIKEVTKASRALKEFFSAERLVCSGVVETDAKKGSSYKISLTFKDATPTSLKSDFSFIEISFAFEGLTVHFIPSKPVKWKETGLHGELFAKAAA